MYVRVCVWCVCVYVCACVRVVCVWIERRRVCDIYVCESMRVM